jgi:hypothetical protein
VSEFKSRVTITCFCPLINEIFKSATETKNPQPPRQSSEPPEKKRRPGRPRGSKNRKPRGSGSEVPGKQPIAGFFSYPSQTLHPAGPGSVPPALPDVNAQNQQYYEFQWRVLNLCAEFYGAAEELVVSSYLLFHDYSAEIVRTEINDSVGRRAMLPDGSW